MVMVCLEFVALFYLCCFAFNTGPVISLSNFQIATGGYDGSLKVFNESLDLIYTIQAHDLHLNRVKQSSFSNKLVATCSSDKTVKIWNASKYNWQLVRTYTKHTHFVVGLEFLNADTIASGALDSTIRIWSMSTGVTKKEISTGYYVYCLQLLSNKVHLAVGLGYPSNSIGIYDINTGNLIKTLQGHINSLVDLVLMSSNILASSSHDWTIRIWDLSKGNSKFNLTGHKDYAMGLKQVSRDILISGSADYTIKMWNIKTGKLIRTFEGHERYVLRSVDLLNDKKTLVSGSFDSTIKMWDIQTGQCLKTINTGSAIAALSVIRI
jgi:WD40 repeat protein